MLYIICRKLKNINKKIIDCLRKGDNHEVLKTLYKEVFPKVRSYVLSNAGNEEEAFDIFQDAVVILCKYIKQGNYDSEKEVGGFLYHVSRNLWINKVKHDKHVVQLPTGFEQGSFEDFSNEIVTQEKENILKKIIELLGEKCFRLLQYSIYEEISYSEICRIMGFSTINAVKTQKYKCKQKLFKLMEDIPSIREVLE